MRKKSILLSALIIVAFTMQLCVVSAIDLAIKEREISSVAIIELDEPAIFELNITNNEEELGTFEIYSLVGRIDLEPKESFVIAGNSTQTVTLEAYPRDTAGTFSFEYKIRDSKGDIQTDSVAINIVNLKDAFNLYADNINPDSEKAIVHFDNKGGHEFGSIKADFSSVFFKDSYTFSLSPKEQKTFKIDINREKAKELLAGPYILNAEIEVEGETAIASSIIRFTEESGLETVEITEGFLLRRHEITRINRGNTPQDVETVFRKNALTALITTFNIAPDGKDTVGFNTFYIFEKKLAPGEELKVIERTNWWIPVLIILAICLITYLAKNYAQNKLKITKRATFVRTKGGEFALKISVILKARDFVEKIKVIDRLPGMVKLYERFGTTAPDKIDEQNKRLEWNIEHLEKGEERIFSYIIYSKMGIVGRFELPGAEAFYEYKGALKEASSNRAFFVNEPERQRQKDKIQKMIDEML